MAVDLVHVDPTRTIVLWCPDWPVFAACRESGLDPEAPVALTEGGQIYACSAAARRDGVVRGLKLREAQYRSPGLTLLDYDASLDVRVFEPVVRRVEETVPGVQLIRPGTLAMRARGPARYYGGEDAAARALLDTVAALDVVGARVGVADGPFAAEQAARAAGG
ncbi:MAG TPA: DNA polymerase Y family protein, partial [Agromyces sp.]